MAARDKRGCLTPQRIDPGAIAYTKSWLNPDFNPQHHIWQLPISCAKGWRGQPLWPISLLSRCMCRPSCTMPSWSRKRYTVPFGMIPWALLRLHLGIFLLTRSVMPSNAQHSSQHRWRPRSDSKDVYPSKKKRKRKQSPPGSPSVVEAELAEWYKEHPIFYDRKRRDYKDSEKKRKLLEDKASD